MALGFAPGPFVCGAACPQADTVPYMAQRLTDMVFDEVSFVSRGANPLSDIVLFKSDVVEKSCDHQDNGHGKCKNCKADMAHMKRSGSAMSKAVCTECGAELGDATTCPECGADQQSEDSGSIRDAGAPYVQPPKGSEADSSKSGKTNKGNRNMQKADLPESIQDLMFDIDDTPEAITEFIDNLVDKSTEDVEEENVETEESILAKADPAVRSLVEKMQNATKDALAKADYAESIAKAERERRLNSEFVETAKSFDALPVDPAEFGPVLKSIAEADPVSYEKVFSVLKAANAAALDLFKTTGTSARGSLDGTSVAKADEMAQALISKNADLTYEQAYERVLANNPSLYRDMIEEV